MKPTIGRVVWYYPPGDEQVLPALISYVHSDTLINVGGFAQNGAAFGATSVPFNTPKTEGAAWACWPVMVEAEPKATKAKKKKK